MAKDNNLTDFLKDVADAIRAKKGTNGAINPQDFSSEIASIQSGGEVISKEINQVCFLDTDGTILHSYTKEQFLELSSLPELPSRDGLICQGWNYSLEDAQLYVMKYGYLTIGAIYITDDGSTRLYIRIETEGRRNVPIYIYQSVSNGVGIDWGDNSPVETIEGTGYINASHQYTKLGEYVIRLVVSEGKLGFGSGSSSYSLMGDTSASGRVYCNMLHKLELGNNVTSIGGYALQYCSSLKSCSIPIGVTTLGTFSFAYCYSLESLIAPTSVTSIGSYAFRDCHAIKSISLAYGIKTFSTAIFYYCSSLSRFSIPKSITNLGVYCFQYSSALSYLNIPESVTNFGALAIANCNGIGVYNFSNYTSVPKLSNANVFNGIQSDCVIVVPTELLEEWKAATNWSTFADKIISVDDYS